ncbi:MAG: hypothetical protein V2I32_05095 [Desulforhopalus sp.]|jgi:hypothetical protein|nr:hypothetical protein [Desulforhopalus sp.]
MRTALLLFILAATVTACASRIPEPVNHPYSQQKKLQASQHWEVLAYDLAGRINKQLIQSDHITQAVFVEETCGDEGEICAPGQVSAFNEAFRDLLITNLVDYGVPTSNHDHGEAIKVLYKVQVVRHRANRVRTIQPGVLTGLSAAILVLRNAPSELRILAGGIAADVANSTMATHSRHEVIITTSMIRDNHYLFRASDIYYINDRDFWHYQENLSKSKTIQLTSASSPEKAATVAILSKVPDPPATVTVPDHNENL